MEKLKSIILIGIMLLFMIFVLTGGPIKGPKGRDVLIQSLDELDKKLQELGC